MSITAQTVKYLQETFPNASFLKDIKLRQKESGEIEIYYWGLGVPRPSDEELNAAAASMVEKPLPPTVEEALLLIYNDMKNGTKTFVKAMDDSK